METKKATKRQPTSVPFLTPASNGLHFDVEQGEVADGILHGVDLSEPTMGEKLADLSFPDEIKFRSDKEQDSSVPTKPPSADSVYVLLRQALNADDRTLLLDCLYTQDEKVITKSIAQLNPANVLKFLHSLISITESSYYMCSSMAQVFNSTACKCDNVPGIFATCFEFTVSVSEFEIYHKAEYHTCIAYLLDVLEKGILSSICISIWLISTLELVATVVDEVDEGETVPVFYEDEDSAEESEDLESDQDDSDEEGSEGVSDIEESNDMMSE
ncbi:hypothetical protein Fmac_020022 [Flemingia macrophylla]|uniref:Uncharacterized protein n=1 Tax=Flemingia macrophylla TaxID=520843 RepID=A0ABD1M9G7_9FABA